MFDQTGQELTDWLRGRAFGSFSGGTVMVQKQDTRGGYRGRMSSRYPTGAGGDRSVRRESRARGRREGRRDVIIGDEHEVGPGACLAASGLARLGASRWTGALAVFTLDQAGFARRSGARRSAWEALRCPERSQGPACLIVLAIFQGRAGLLATAHTGRPQTTRQAARAA